MDIGIFEAGAFGAATAIAMKSLEFAITIARRRLNGNPGGNPGGEHVETLVLGELKTLNELMGKAVGSLAKSAEILDDTRERVKENQGSIDKMHRDVLLMRGKAT